MNGFPVTPYGVQVAYVQHLEKALSSKTNAALESPTGTGKTLALLCGILGWREKQGKVKPTVVFTSRTHSQLHQAVKELRKTRYRPRTALLASRKHLCVHPDVRRIDSTFKQNSACRALVKCGKCQYYENVVPRDVDEDCNIYDIEDLVTMGEKRKVCPYYYSGRMLAKADVAFLPYNYIFDSKHRKSVIRLSGDQFSLENSIVVVDEAHNLPGVCQDASSFELLSSDISAATKQIDKVIKALEKKFDSANVSGYVELRTGLLKFEKAIADCAGKVQEGTFIYELFATLGATKATEFKIESKIDYAMDLLGAQANSTALDKLKRAISLAFSKKSADMSSYRVYVEKPKDSFGPILNFWCFSPKVAVRDIVKAGVSSLVLTSGTLSPLDSLKYEFDLKFPVMLENPHVIGNDQMWCGIISTGPSGKKLNSSYANRTTPEYQSELGNSIVNFARVVPDGLLVFFPSYAAMNESLEYWGKEYVGRASILSRMEKYKPYIVEPRVGDFKAAIEEYRSAIRTGNGKGAILFAVCRGKSSEGIDFSDQDGRGVVLTGIPYPNATAPQIKIKQNLLNATNEGMSGKEWYSQQAYKAVNQAIGRVIRHVDDFGAVLLCDERFGWSSSVHRISRWVHPFLKQRKGYGDGIASLTRFFKNCSENPKLCNARKATALAEPSFVPKDLPADDIKSPLKKRNRVNISLQKRIPDNTPRLLDGIVSAEMNSTKIKPQPLVRKPVSSLFTKAPAGKRENSSTEFYMDLKKVASKKELKMFIEEIVPQLKHFRKTPKENWDRSKSMEFLDRCRLLLQRKELEPLLPRLKKLLPVAMQPEFIPLSGKESRDAYLDDMDRAFKGDKTKIAAFMTIVKKLNSSDDSVFAESLLRELENLIGGKLFLRFHLYNPKRFSVIFEKLCQKNSSGFVIKSE